jgi:hypothetical protein
VAGAIPSFRAVATGDGDHHMIMGTQFFVAPSLDPTEPRLSGYPGHIWWAHNDLNCRVIPT